jgi:hypothetical protein
VESRRIDDGAECATQCRGTRRVETITGAEEEKCVTQNMQRRENMSNQQNGNVDFGRQYGHLSVDEMVAEVVRLRTFEYDDPRYEEALRRLAALMQHASSQTYVITRGMQLETAEATYHRAMLDATLTRDERARVALCFHLRAWCDPNHGLEGFRGWQEDEQSTPLGCDPSRWHQDQTNIAAAGEP